MPTLTGRFAARSFLQEPNMLRSVDVNGRVPKPALKPYPNFNADHDAEVLKKAMDGLGTDEAMVVEILGHRTSSQRLQIASRYKALYGKDLREDLDSELSGDFGELVDLLFFTPAELKAEICYKAIRGLGTDEDALIEVICTATTAELQQLKQEYAKVLQKHGKVGSIDSLEEHIKSDTSGYFRRILLALLAAQRPEPTEEQIQTMLNKGVDTFIDRKAARADAEALYNAGEKKLGTDEATFINILCNRNPWQLMAISKAYEEISKLRLIEAIASETSGDFKHALITTLTAQISRPMAFAELLNRAIAGLGTNDDELMRIVVWRSEIDMEDVKNAYLTRYNESLEEAIKEDTSGDYEKLLLALIGC
ncbi:Annexin A6 [Sparganum proliferum]